MTNNGMMKIDLIYQGMSEKTGAYQLSRKQAKEYLTVFGRGRKSVISLSFSSPFSS
jgi:hypothetical protein